MPTRANSSAKYEAVRVHLVTESGATVSKFDLCTTSACWYAATILPSVRCCWAVLACTRSGLLTNLSCPIARLHTTWRAKLSQPDGATSAQSRLVKQAIKLNQRRGIAVHQIQLASIWCLYFTPTTSPVSGGTWHNVVLIRIRSAMMATR